MNFDEINYPEDLSKLSDDELQELSKLIRRYIIKTVSKTGGHLASNLGIVELTVAIHASFNAPKDRIVFDVGHQCYAHKILTGRKEDLPTLRTKNGLSGFPSRDESIYDSFGTGHAGTSVSAALGIDRAEKLLNGSGYTVAVVGDGALGNGMIYEAINDAGNSSNKLIIILNDNNMSISPNVGAISTTLSRMRGTKRYISFKKGVQKLLNKTPRIDSFLHRMKNGFKYMVVNGALFEELGLFYMGPVDGHDIQKMRKAIERAKSIEGPVLLHFVTQKGHGYKAAEKDPTRFHSASAFSLRNGKKLVKKSGRKSFSDAVSESLLNIARKDDRIVAITAAMPDATGLSAFKKEFPDRFFDVGIAEEHAVTMAAGMASNGLKPIVAIYSTFLQRAFDSILHDVCIQNLPVVILADHSGIVGEDGRTHQGVFDISFLNAIPNITILSPMSPDEMLDAIQYAICLNSPCVIRYPKGSGGAALQYHGSFPGVVTYGEPESKNKIITNGVMVRQAIEACDELLKKGIQCQVACLRQIRPADKFLKGLIYRGDNIVTLEDTVLKGGFGSIVSEFVIDQDLQCRILRLGVPDRFIEHQTREEALAELKLDAPGIVEQILAHYEGKDEKKS